MLADRAEAALRRARLALERPLPFHAAAALLVLLALVVRLPLALHADDVSHGHPDSWVYFHQAYAEYLNGNLFPDAHRGSGWQLLLFATLSALGIDGGQWTGYHTEMTGEAARAALVAHTLSATLSAGAVAATILLGRDLLPRWGALVAGALIALDPFLLRTATSAMSEPVYVPLFVLATLTTLRARRHLAWLVATGALMALAHVLRVNGLVMFAMLMLYAWVLLRVPVPLARRAPGAERWTPRAWLREHRRFVLWGLAAGATFLLVASPYLLWRHEELPHAFDYGTNQRFWADELWDLDDAWWTNHTAKGGAPRETMKDYFARHSASDALVRLWLSAQWQVFDLFGSGRWPPFQTEGGQWVGSPQEDSALTPLVAGLSLVAAFTLLRRREWAFLPLALLVTFLTFLWIYPLVRSVRYFAPLIPLFTLAAVGGYAHLARLVRRPHLVGALLFGAQLLLYGAAPLVHAPEAWTLLARSADARVLAGLAALLWVGLVLAPLLRRARSGPSSG